MKVVEMVGCPGCGKSTTCNIATLELRDKGYRVGNVADFYFEHRKNGKKAGLILRILLDFANYPLYFDALRIKIKYCRRLSQMKYVGSLVFFLYELMYVTRSNKYDILLLDEGIVQYISSLLYEEKLSESFLNDAIYKHLFKRHLQPSIVFCDLEINENIRRLRNRGVLTRFARIEGEEELERIMRIRRHNLQVISKGFSPVTTISMIDSPEQNALAIETLCIE